VNRRWPRRLAFGAALVAGVAMVAVLVVVPAVLLRGLDDHELNRWSQLGQALEPVGIFFSGVAFFGIALTLFLQGRDLQNQREELAVAREEQRRGSEIAVRQQHTDLIQMAIADRELREVWPPLAPGVAETKKDHYCNLILNLQKVAYETRVIERDELRGALENLLTSPDMYAFWRKARVARRAVTGGDEAEDLFSAEVDRAFAAVRPAGSRGRLAMLWARATSRR
jgi:hypothetical protein